MNTETRLQEIERKLANIESSSLGRAGQLELPLDPTTQALLVQAVIQNASQVTSSLIPNTVHGRQVFTSSGDFTVPSGVRYVDVECVGCGGGGAVYAGVASNGSGGGGAYTKKIVDLNGVSTVSVTIGNVGSGADSWNDGSTSYYTNATDGGSVSFGSYLSANGGIRGEESRAGGTATGGDINIDGQDGGKALEIVNGSSSSDNVWILGPGGNSFLGYGGIQQTIGYNGEVSSNDGQVYGGGGGMGKGYSYSINNHYYGGDGGAGVVIVTY